MQRTAAPTAVRAALAQEESKRDAAREKLIAATTPVGDAETRWELSYVHRTTGGGGAGTAKVVDWGYSEILADDRREDGGDSEAEEEENEEEEKEKGSGRMVFGSFKPKGQVRFKCLLACLLAWFWLSVCGCVGVWVCTD